MFKLLVLKQALVKMPTTKDRNSFSVKTVPNQTLGILSIIHIFLAVLSLTQSVESTRKYPILLICYPCFNFKLANSTSPWLLELCGTLNVLEEKPIKLKIKFCHVWNAGWMSVFCLFFSNFRARYCRYKYAQQQELRTVTNIYTQRQACLRKPTRKCRLPLKTEKLK